jgi:hypothetical protein
MLVPEAAVDENYLSAGNENEVGLPRQILAMERITIAH